jgi:ferrous iron transport protein B
MNPKSDSPVIRVALLGNPNTGKSTLFTALCGVHQRTGNYPGVTVEKKVGTCRIDAHEVRLIDLPGTYSLAPTSPDEMVTVDVLLGRQSDVGRPDAILCIVDAANLQRNLYLVSQALELGLPTVVALNMIDVANRRGTMLDARRLERQLGVPVVPIQANSRVGIDKLRRELIAAAVCPRVAAASPMPADFQSAVAWVAAQMATNGSGSPVPKYLIERLLLDTGYLESAKLPGIDSRTRDTVRLAREKLTQNGVSLATLEPLARYQWVAEVTQGVVQQSAAPSHNPSDRIDRILTHRLWGMAFFLIVMTVIFQSVFWWAVPVQDLIESFIGQLGEATGDLVPAGPLQSLLINGVFGGVGGVLVFLPQIAILFLFIAVLEDCGYMARAAYLMDRLMSRAGLSGKSFIPLLSSFACAVPGIMAARVIDNRRDRFVTMLVAPLMSCAARLPVYTLLIEAVMSGSSTIVRGLTLLAMYLIGIVFAIVVAWILRKTMFQGSMSPFIMELPSYKLPDARVVLYRVFERCKAFVVRAGTVIFAVSVLVWAVGYYPRRVEQVESPYRQRRAELEEQIAQLSSTPSRESETRLTALQTELDRLEREIDGEHIRQSYLGRIGRYIEPVVKPLGWDWRIGCAVVASFPAREVVVGTLGVIYNLGDEQNERSLALHEAVRSATWDGTGRPVFTIPVALSLMAFFALCAQCASTLVTLRRETNSWGWPVFSFVYMTALAYVVAFATYQIASRV